MAALVEHLSLQHDDALRRLEASFRLAQQEAAPAWQVGSYTATHGSCFQ